MAGISLRTYFYVELSACNLPDIQKLSWQLHIHDYSTFIIAENFDRSTTPVTKHEHLTTERIACKHLPAYPGQPVDAFAEIHRLYGQQNPHLGSYLDHRLSLRSPESASSTGATPVPFTLMSIRDLRRAFTFRVHL